MKSILPLVALVATLTVSIGLPVDAFATDYVNWLTGGASEVSNASQKGARTYITIQSGAGDHSFSHTDEEDHNYHIQIKDSSNYIHNVGYFVRDDATTTAKFFAEVFNSGGTRVLNFESMGAVASDGTNQVFASHRSSTSWSFYDGTGFGDLQAQYSGGGTSYNTSTGYVLFEKGCKGGCVIGDMGDAPTVKFNTAFEYMSGSSYTSGGWTALGDAGMYYYATGPSGSVVGGSAKSIMCPTMTAEGNIQDGGLSDNQMNALDAPSITCTSEAADLWN